MNTAVIGCRTIEKELTAAMEQTRLTYPIYWLEAGPHNVPQQLHQALQEQIDRCGDRERVLLAMGFCGNAVCGLRSGPGELVIPRVDDCISLLLGVTRWLGFNIPMLYLLNALVGMYGLVWSQVAADILTVAVSFLVYFKFRPAMLRRETPQRS